MPKPTVELPDIPAGWLDAPETGAQRHWVQLPRPTELEAGEPGSGYYTYGTDKTGRPGTAADAQWGGGNISLKGGADFRPDHKAHRDGLGIDIRPSRIDGAQKAVTYRDRQYDREATQRLIDAFHATGQVTKILFNDGRARGVHLGTDMMIICMCSSSREDRMRNSPLGAAIAVAAILCAWPDFAISQTSKETSIPGMYRFYSGKLGDELGLPNNKDAKVSIMVSGPLAARMYRHMGRAAQRS